MHFDYMFQYFLLLNNKINNALVINSFIPKIFFLNILILVYIWLDYEARKHFIGPDLILNIPVCT